MSTQINNASLSSITPTYESLHWIYASAKSPSGYVIHTKRLQNKDAVWTCPSLDQAQMWVSHQLLMKQRQAAIDSGMTKAQAVATITLDTTTTSSYNVETTKVEDTTMNIESMSLVELAALQTQVANRIHFLLTSDNNDTSSVAQTETLQPEDVAESSVESQDTAPSSAPAEEATPKRRVVKSKKVANIEAVAEKIEATLCVMSRDEARTYIKERKLPIKGNMSCEKLNDAINAYNQGGVEAVPAEYLTKTGVKQLETAAGFAEKEAAPVAKKILSRSKSSKAK